MFRSNFYISTKENTPPSSQFSFTLVLPVFLLFIKNNFSDVQQLSDLK